MSDTMDEDVFEEEYEGEKYKIEVIRHFDYAITIHVYYRDCNLSQLCKWGYIIPSFVAISGGMAESSSEQLSSLIKIVRDDITSGYWKKMYDEKNAQS